MDYTRLRTISYQCVLDLATSEGIHASSINEAFGCIFGRDSALTVLKLLNVYAKTKDKKLLELCRRTLLTLTSLQGKVVNIESGEEPGKIIHEFRKDNYERLIKRAKPWYVYADKKLRNYDSVDSTPLTLIALYRYWKLTKDEEFLLHILPSVEQGLRWLSVYADKDQDHLIEYEFFESRTFGGLPVQSWTDSFESLADSKGEFPIYPIAAVEVQAYAWLAYKSWAHFYTRENRRLSNILTRLAHRLKQVFNQKFIFYSDAYYFAAQALDGNKKQVRTITGNPLLCLWASYQEENEMESIVDEKYIPEFVKRGFQPDLFDPEGGVRTMSMRSPTYDPHHSSYHNGSFWPILNSLIYEGLSMWQFKTEASLLKEASLKPILYFDCPIELYIKHEELSYLEYVSPRSGKNGCRYQAWTAAGTLDLVTT